VLNHLPNKILQGVTTEIVGNCGFSLFPTKPNPNGERLTGEIFDGEPEEGMASADSYFSALEQAGSFVNVAALTGHAALRIYAARMRRQLAEEEMKTMERALSECLDTGSAGLSTGLNCPPSSFADSDEVVRLCKLVKKYNAFYTTHMRDYKFRVIEAVDEALAVARSVEVPLQISHMQVVGRKNWDKMDAVLEQVERAFREGVDVAMDAYPYLAGSCSITQLLPDWSQEGGIAALLGHLASPLEYRRIAQETDGNMSNSWDDIVVCNVRTLGNRPCIGRSIQQIADAREKPAVDTALDLLREEEGHLYILSFNQNLENLRKVLTHPLTSIITDGMMMEGISHPRTFGTYPKFLGEFVRERGWMSLEEAIAKTSVYAARRFQLEGRGTIEPGHWADITVFDAARIRARSDYEEPAREPEGIHHVLVNGRFAVRDGKLTGELAGATLRHSKR
jgi:dihydroorotase/N-acyl-D-amino-acid deacylase